MGKELIFFLVQYVTENTQADMLFFKQLFGIDFFHVLFYSPMSAVLKQSLSCFIVKRYLSVLKPIRTTSLHTPSAIVLTLIQYKQSFFFSFAILTFLPGSITCVSQIVLLYKNTDSLVCGK